MNGKSITFNDKRSTRVISIKTKTKISIKHQFLKKNFLVEKAHLNYLLDIMIMMILDHYV